LLLPGHGGSTLRAFALDAGHAALVWFLLSAFRTQAGSDIASRKGSAHATSTLSTTLALSAAFSRSTASSFFHFVFLLSLCRSFSGHAAGRDRNSPAWQIRRIPSCH
jgi:hypothetical protein